MKKEQGLTLVEVIATIAILGVVILAFIQLSNHNRTSDLQSEVNNEANRIIEQIINELRSEFTSTTNLQQLITTKETQYNTTYASQYRFHIQSATAASSVNFTNPCSPAEARTSIPFTLFYNNTSYVISISACWSK